MGARVGGRHCDVTGIAPFIRRPYAFGMYSCNGDKAGEAVKDVRGVTEWSAE